MSDTTLVHNEDTGNPCREDTAAGALKIAVGIPDEVNLLEETPDERTARYMCNIQNEREFLVIPCIAKAIKYIHHGFDRKRECIAGMF